MYFFYIVKTKFDTGFGITSNYESRHQDYVAHAGPNSGIYFPVVLNGHTPHIKKLESLIKTQWLDRTFITRAGWKTEWLRENEDTEAFLKDLMNVIIDRHYRIEIYIRDYDFLKR